LIKTIGDNFVMEERDALSKEKERLLQEKDKEILYLKDKIDMDHLFFFCLYSFCQPIESSVVRCINPNFFSHSFNGVKKKEEK